MENKKQQIEIERDQALRLWCVNALSHDILNGFRFTLYTSGECQLEITDKLIRKLCFNFCHPYKSWQEWKAREEEFEKNHFEFQKEVKKFKKLPPDRVVTLNSSAADIVAKAEQLAEKEIEAWKIK